MNTRGVPKRAGPGMGTMDNTTMAGSAAPHFPRPDPDAGADRPTFRDPGLQASFAEGGYALVDLLDADEVDEFRARYAEIRPAGETGLTVDYMRTDRSIMTKVRRLVEPVLAPRIEELLTDHEICFVSFVTKHPGDGSDMFLHEDRSFVDERYSRSGTLWIPLVDVGPHVPSGALSIVPGSHRLGTTFSGSLTPQTYRPYESDLRDGLVTPSVRAGQALFYDSRTLHSSESNLSEEPREAIVCAIVPKDTDLVHVIADGRRHRRMFRVDQGFYVDHQPRDVESRMPDQYDVVAEWDEEPESIGPLVAELMALQHDPEPGVAFGSTLVAPDAVAAERVDWDPGSDQHVDADALTEPDDLVSAHRYRTTGGSCGVAALVGVHRIDALDQTIEADLVVLEPQSSMELTVGAAPGLEVRIFVLDAPLFGAHANTKDGSTQLDPGVSVRVDATDHVEIHADGPGQTVIVVAMVVSGGRRIPLPAMRLLRRFRAVGRRHQSRLATGVSLDSVLTG